MSQHTRLSHLPLLLQTLDISGLPLHLQDTIAQIDAVLPQTQCGLCGHLDGCLPYAHGVVVKQEAYNLCVPGGQAVSDQLSDILTQAQLLAPNSPKLTATPSKWDTDPATNRPQEVKAIINEDDCIGCTKCIPACPVDAIIGTAKHSHTIIADLCTGCELCLPPCPVDCIELVPSPRIIDQKTRTQEQDHLRKRYHHHLNRVASTITQGTKPVVSAIESVMSNVIVTEQHTAQIDSQSAKNAIELAKIRTQLKKLDKQLSVKESPQLRQKHDLLTQELNRLQTA